MKKMMAMILVLSISFTMTAGGFGAGAKSGAQAQELKKDIYDEYNHNVTLDIMYLQELAPVRGNLKGTFDPGEAIEKLNPNFYADWKERTLYYLSESIASDTAYYITTEDRRRMLTELCEEIGVTLSVEVSDDQLAITLAIIEFLRYYEFDLNTIDYNTIDEESAADIMTAAEINWVLGANYTIEEYNNNPEVSLYADLFQRLSGSHSSVEKGMSFDELVDCMYERFPRRDVSAFSPYVYDYTLALENNDTKTLDFTYLVRDYLNASVRMFVNGKEVVDFNNVKQFTVDLSKTDKDGNLNLTIEFDAPPIKIPPLLSGKSVKGGTEYNDKKIVTTYNVDIKIKGASESSKESSEDSSETKPVPDTGTAQPVAIFMVAALAAGVLAITRKHKKV